MHNLFMGDFWFHYYSVLQEQRGTVRSDDGHSGSGAAHRTKQKNCVKSQIFPKNNVSLRTIQVLRKQRGGWVGWPIADVC